MNEPSKLVVGLGNPGDRYAGTRHNVGAMAVESAVKQLGANVVEAGQDQAKPRVYRAGQVLLALPTDFMNVLGGQVKDVAKRYGIPADSILTVSDDLDLPFGELRLRSEGGTGGHKGLASIHAKVGTADIGRLRIGIGRPPEGADAADFVLQKFSAAERKQLPSVLEEATNTIRTWIDG